MNLLLDCGNSRIKFACLENGKRSPAQALDYVSLKQISQYIKQAPSDIWAVNVASTTNKNAVNQLALDLWGIEIKWCNSNTGKQYLASNYASSLGADRWFAVLGLLSLVQNQADWLNGVPYILASFGTATTIDTIQLDSNHNAKFLGGLILPGFEMMRQSLANGTAQLPITAGATAPFPLDTNTAINSGIIAAQSGALLRQWHLSLNNNLAPNIYVCGGAWHSISQSINDELKSVAPEKCTYLDYPVLDGLAFIVQQSNR